MGKCCIPNCVNNICGDVKNPKVRFFRFPKKEFLKTKWKKAINYTGRMRAHTAVCSNHFEPSSILKNNKLIKNTIPTIFTSSCEALNNNLIKEESDTIISSISDDEISEPNSKRTYLGLDEKSPFHAIFVSTQDSRTIIESLSDSDKDEEAGEKALKLLPSQDSSDTINSLNASDKDDEETDDKSFKGPTKITLKRALHSPTFDENLSSAGRKIRDKAKIKILREAYTKIKLENRRLYKKVRRRTMRIDKLKKSLEDAKNSNLCTKCKKYNN